MLAKSFNPDASKIWAVVDAHFWRLSSICNKSSSNDWQICTLTDHVSSTIVYLYFPSQYMFYSQIFLQYLFELNWQHNILKICLSMRPLIENITSIRQVYTCTLYLCSLLQIQLKQGLGILIFG